MSCSASTTISGACASARRRIVARCPYGRDPATSPPVIPGAPGSGSAAAAGRSRGSAPASAGPGAASRLDVLPAGDAGADRLGGVAADHRVGLPDGSRDDGAGGGRGVVGEGPPPPGGGAGPPPGGVAGL